MSGYSGSSGGHRGNRNVRGRLDRAPAPPAVPALPLAAAAAAAPPPPPPLAADGAAPEIAAPAAPEIAAPELLHLFPVVDPVLLPQAGAAPELLHLFPVDDPVLLPQAGAAPEPLPLFPVDDPVLFQVGEPVFLQALPPPVLYNIPIVPALPLPAFPPPAAPINLDDLPFNPPPHVPPPVLPPGNHPPPPPVYTVIPDFPQYPLGGDNQDYLHLFKKRLSQSDISNEIKITGENLPFFQNGVKVKLCSQKNTCTVRVSLLSGGELIRDQPVNLRIANMGIDVSLSWHQLLGVAAAQLFVGQRVFGWFRWIEVVEPNEQNVLTVGPIDPNNPNAPKFTLHIVIQIQV